MVLGCGKPSYGRELRIRISQVLRNSSVSKHWKWNSSVLLMRPLKRWYGIEETLVWESKQCGITGRYFRERGILVCIDCSMSENLTIGRCVSSSWEAHFMPGAVRICYDNTCWRIIVLIVVIIVCDRWRLCTVAYSGLVHVFSACGDSPPRESTQCAERVLGASFHRAVVFRR